jgi:hypothetical protein
MPELALFGAQLFFTDLLQMHVHFFNSYFRIATPYSIEYYGVLDNHFCSLVRHTKVTKSDPV